MLQIPSFAVVEDIRNLWALLKRPANIYLVADVSGSMAGDKLDRAKEALLSFIEQVRGNTDNLALATFATDVREVVPLGPIAQNRERLRSAVRDLRATGNTALYDATLFGAERLYNLKQTDRINVVLVMSDGIENSSRRVRSGGDPRPLITSLEELSRRSGVPVLVFTVAYGGDADINTLRQVSESTRGAAYEGNPETIRRLYQLLSAFF
jgi:Ca-activated chloride channel family protein